MEKKKRVHKLSKRANAYMHRTALVFQRKGIEGKVLKLHRGVRHLSADIVLTDPTILDKVLNPKTTDAVALACNSPTVSAHRVDGIVRYTYMLPEMYYAKCLFGNQTTGLGVGLGDAFKQVNYSLEIPHTLVAGTTGSGKTVITQAIALAAIRQHKEDSEELKLVILDPNNDYIGFDHCLHLARPIARNEVEFTRNLQWVYHEFKLRKTKNLRHETRVILFIDEAEEILHGEDLEMVRRLTAGGRAFKISVVVTTQKPTERDLPGLISNLKQRFIGTVTSARISADLTGFPGLKAQELLGQGDFLRVAGGNPVHFQVAMVLPGDYTALPRGEVAFEETKDEELGEDMSIDEPEADETPLIAPKKVVGRPARDADAWMFAYYLVHGPHTISIAYATDELKISKEAHFWYRDFVAQMMDEAMKIKNEHINTEETQ